MRFVAFMLMKRDFLTFYLRPLIRKKRFQSRLPILVSYQLFSLYLYAAIQPINCFGSVVSNMFIKEVIAAAKAKDIQVKEKVD